MSGDSVTKRVVGRTRINVRLDVVALLLLFVCGGRRGPSLGNCVTTFGKAKSLVSLSLKFSEKIVRTQVVENKISSVAAIEELLKSKLDATHMSITDTSGSCGSAFEIQVCVSPKFEGKNSLTKQRLVTKALEKEMDKIHALSMKKLISPEEYANLSLAINRGPKR